MKNRIVNMLAVAFLSVAASLAASAQAVQNHPPQPISPKLESAHPGNGSSMDSSMLSADSAFSPSLATGWNYVHAANCALFYSSGLPYLYVYTKEGPYFWTTNAVYQGILEPACQSGNWLAFYVFNGSTGAWNEIYTYTYK